ncbi:MAG: polysaccharide deacetylase family protein [Methylobacteriaceae bacterium]|nr:polysaccharide deacetylase family protein [Methylobacteriaceae bacterium]
MSEAHLAPVRRLLDQAGAEGRTVAFWWRDDDAVRPTPALERLLGLREACGVPLAVAAIPGPSVPALAERLCGDPEVRVLVHGLAHANHAGGGAKAAEFGADRGVEALTRDAETALTRARATFGRLALPVFVPPWNRIAPGLVAALPGLGFRGLSAFGRVAEAIAAPGLRIVNTHVAPIAWRGSRSLLDPDALAASFARHSPLGMCEGEPIGLLTHHLVQDEAVWSFCERLLHMLSGHPAARCLNPAELWGDGTRRVAGRAGDLATAGSGAA